MPEDASIDPLGAAEIQQPEPPIAHGPRWIFFGEQGLRAGWSALLFIAIFMALGFVLGMAVKHLTHFHPPDPKAPSSPTRALIGEFIPALLVLFASWIMARVEGRRLLNYGYAGRAKLSRFLWGCVWGFIALSVLVVTLWRTHLLAFDAGRLHGATAWKYALAWLAVFVVVAIFEESLLRGYLQYTLTRGVGFWWGALLMSIVFGAIHGSNKGESPVGLFSAGAVGLVFCISLWYTGSLWWAIGFHASWDWAQSYFYGTPDSGLVTRGHLLTEHPVGPLLWSGGPTGPEGSLYIVPLLLVMALLMWLWWRRNGVREAYRQDV